MGYTPVGASAILADIICPVWPGTLPLSSRVLAKQGRASLGSTKYVGGDCTATMSLLAKASLCQWVGQILASCGSGHFDDVINGHGEATAFLCMQ